MGKFGRYLMCLIMNHHLYELTKNTYIKEMLSM